MKFYKLLKLLLISSLALLIPPIVNAKIINSDERINENIKTYTPLYGFGEGIVEYVEIKETPIYFLLKLENPVLIKPKPLAIYGQEFIGYTNKDSKLQLFTSNINPLKTKKGKQPVDLQALNEPIPVTPDNHTWEYKASNGEKYTITIKIEEKWLPIEITDSGWLTPEYKDARVFKAELIVTPLSHPQHPIKADH